MEESDNKGSLPDLFNMNGSGSNYESADDVEIRDEHRSQHTERDDDVTDRVASTNAPSRASSEVTQKIRKSISQMSPIDGTQQLTLLLHERCRQFNADTDFLREMLANNLTRSQKDLDDAHEALKLLEVGIKFCT